MALGTEEQRRRERHASGAITGLAALFSALLEPGLFGRGIATFAIGQGQDSTELAVKDEGRTAALPKLGIAFSLSPSLEIGADFQIKHIGGAASESISRFGDIELKAKQLILDAEDNAAGINMSAELKISLPTGDAARGFGDGRPAIKLPITFSRRDGPWKFGGLIGVQHAFKNDRTATLGGVLATRNLSDAWKVGAELVAEWHFEQREPEELMTNVGLRYAPSRRTELFILAGRSIDTRANNELGGIL